MEIERVFDSLHHYFLISELEKYGFLNAGIDFTKKS